MEKLRASAGRSKITPLAGVDLAGYAHREGSSVGLHDDLWYRALVLDDGNIRLVLIALDLLSIDFELDGLLRAAVAEAAQTDLDHVLINCSHTHAGPAITARQSLGERNRDYVASLPNQVAKTAAEAARRLAPCSLRHGEAPIRVGINRRETRPDGEVVIGRNPEGIVDTRVRVLEVGIEGSARGAVMFHHACHGTTLGSENRLISAEWMGAAASQLETTLGGRSIPMFLQGCCGQINPDAEPNFTEVNRIGSEMAVAVTAALDCTGSFEATPLATCREQIGLPFQDPLTPEQAQLQLDKAKTELEHRRQEGAHELVVRAYEGLVAHTARMLERAERGPRKETLPFTIQVLRIGEVAIVGLSGEVFFEFARQIESKSPFRQTMVLGYSNGCTCYIPTEEAFAGGGYEADDSFRWYHIPPLTPQAGAIMAEAAVRLLSDMWNSS